MSDKTDSSLYGKPRAKKQKTTESLSTSNLSFSTTLSSLIKQGTGESSSDLSHGRARPSKTPKPDIFAKPNKGAQQRIASDLSDDSSTQIHKNSLTIGGVDAATLRKSKLKMEEKARMYNELKRGSHITGESSDEEDPSGPEDYLARLRRKEKEGLVDFDRKWADEEEKREKEHGSSEEEADDDNASIISYEDEFGRSRRGTRAEAARANRTKMEESNDRHTRERWQPARPDNLIHGVTVQTEAFNPEANIAAKMAHIATRRDRSPTPEEKHYNADSEVRNRGVAFFNFSQDETERKKQMKGLTKARAETEQARRELAHKQEEKQKERDEYRQAREKQLLELQTNAMLDILGRDMVKTEMAPSEWVVYDPPAPKSSDGPAPCRQPLIIDSETTRIYKLPKCECPHHDVAESTKLSRPIAPIRPGL